NCSGTEEVAVLSEAATTYGAVTRQQTRQCYANFVYPREISTLRNAYKNVPQPQQPGATAGSQPGYLPFTLNDRQPNDSDEPPDFAFQQGPLSKEAVLMDFANDLRRQHFRFIGINGTNILDVLFLANFLRSSCPDSRLFILNSDLLFERSQDNAPYIGMLSVTTYPLIGRNVHWTGGEGLPRQPFADQYEQGQYNAALRAMQTTLPVENGGGTQAGSRFYEIAPPFDRPADGSFPDRLPVWMTVVGTGGYWPVQVLFPAGNEAASGSPKMTPLDFSPAWATTTGVLIALCLAQCLVLLRPSPFASRLRDFAVTGVACSQRLFFINVASACLALCVAMLLTPACRFGPSEGYMWWLFAAGAAAVGCLFATCFRLEFQCRAMLRNCAGERNDHQFLHTLAHAGVWTVAVLGEWLWIALMWDQPGHYSFFFAYRAVHLATGVSPFTPALPLLASVYLWCVFEIWRLRFADQVRPRLLAAGSVDSAVPGAKTEQAIARSVNRFWLRPSYAVSCAILFGIWLFFLHPTDPFEVFEHRAFVWLYEIMLWVAVGLMVSSGFRLGQTWSDLRGLLRELERSPIRLAFARVTESSWSPIWESGDQEDEFIAMARSFELLTVIKSGGALMDDQLKEQVAEAEALRRGLRADWEHYSAGIPGKEKTATAQKLHEQFGVLQDKLAAIMNGMFSKLQAYWASHGTHAADEKDDSARQARGMEEYVALRYVAFIRGALGHVKHLLIFTAACFSLVLIALNIYSFEPHQSLIWSFTVIFAAVGVTVIGVLMEAHRDHILSRITGTKPNELGWQFYVRVAGFGAAPLLTLLATHFPAIGRYLMSLFQPGMEALK
ncbi:MAG TPA: hypothetical protein VLT16_14570, partial [Candidatus Limnocylindrales bacterium]|nr:hypothetical protein [Candidatus Limnocylindrales bacterium]